MFCVQNQPREVVSESEELTDGLRTQVLFAREYLKDVTISEKQVERLVMEAARGACQGHRSELFASRVAKASAALDVRPDPECMHRRWACLIPGLSHSNVHAYCLLHMLPYGLKHGSPDCAEQE